MATSLAPVVPHALDAERAVLAAVLVDGAEAYRRVAERLSAGDFFRDGHQRLWRALGRLVDAEQPIDLITLRATLDASGDLDHAGGVGYIAALATGMPRGAHLDAHVDLVLEAAQRARAKSALTAAIQAVDRGNTDAALDAVDAAGAHLNPPTVPESLRATVAAAVIAEPPPVELIEGIVAEQRVTIMVSESGTGKTFVLLSQAAAVDAGVAWHRRQVATGSVLVLSYEGDALGKRLRALQDVQGYPLDHVYIVRARSPLSPRLTRDGAEEPSIGEREAAACIDDLVARLAAEGKPEIRLLAIDTVRASLAGSEDNSADAAAYLRAARRLLARAPRAGLILTHHAGWQDGEAKRRRERGSSAWRGNSDTVLYLEAGEYDHASGEAELTLSTLKARDGEAPPPLRLIRRRVSLAEVDRYGQPVTSCVIEPDHRSRADREAAQAAAAEEIALELDLLILKSISARPDLATSRESIRALVGRAKRDVSESIDRLIRASLLRQGRRGEPFGLTEAGSKAVQEAA